MNMMAWAHLIAQGSKDIENGRWPTKYRGPFLIHASINIDRKRVWTSIRSVPF
jgi:hypothetical protein